MLLIADSGSSKTDIRVMHNGTIVHHLQSDGINPLLHDTEHIRNSFPTTNQPISKIAYFGAGCSTQERCLRVKNALALLYPKAVDIDVNSDLMGAALAIYRDKPIHCCILGTGSNAAIYDGHALTTPTPSLGYILGDEGSGADLGKIILRDYLYNRLPESISLSVEKHTDKQTAESLVDRLYRGESPNKWLASFAKLLSEHREDDYAKQLLKDRFTAFYHAFLSKSNIVEVGAVGSIAFHFQNELNDVLNQHGLMLKRIYKSPIDGLVDFYRTFAD